MQIQIMTELVAASELKDALEDQLGLTEGLALELRQPKPPVRGVDPTVLVALVGAGSAALGSLVGGICQVLLAKHGRKIVINGAQGRRIELTGQFTKEDIDEFVRQAHEIDAEQIFLR